jgi:hypothetical protein
MNRNIWRLSGGWKVKICCGNSIVSRSEGSFVIFVVKPSLLRGDGLHVPVVVELGVVEEPPVALVKFTESTFPSQGIESN